MSVKNNIEDLSSRNAFYVFSVSIFVVGLFEFFEIDFLYVFCLSVVVALLTTFFYAKKMGAIFLYKNAPSYILDLTKKSNLNEIFDFLNLVLEENSGEIGKMELSNYTGSFMVAEKRLKKESDINTLLALLTHKFIMNPDNESYKVALIDRIKALKAINRDYDIILNNRKSLMTV